MTDVVGNDGIAGFDDATAVDLVTGRIEG